jgi:hypothetical protein
VRWACHRPATERLSSKARYAALPDPLSFGNPEST